MQRAPLRNINSYTLGLLACILALVVGVFLFLYDYNLSEEALLEEAQKNLQEDLKACAAQYDPSLPKGKKRPEGCVACELTYDNFGRLVDWTQSDYLPSKDRFEKLEEIQLNEDFLSIKGQGREYLQIVIPGPEGTKVVLIPIYIRYEVSNDFLIPYVFLGRYNNLFSDEDRKKIKPFEDVRGNYIRLYSVEKGTFLLALNDLPLERFREPIRIAALIALLVGVLGLIALVRFYTLSTWRPRYYSDILLITMLVATRLVFAGLDIPKNYSSLKIFSPKVVAFEELVAPTLGDMSINILLFSFIIWIAYKNLYRIIGVFYWRASRIPGLKWGLMVGSLLVSALLFKGYLRVFELLLDNSQVEIEFSNIFKTDLFSFLILLDMGVLLLGLIFIVFLLLRFNVFVGYREQNRKLFWAVNIGVVLLCNALLYDFHFGIVLLTSASLAFLAIIIYRTPGGKLLNYDLPNYLLLLAVCSFLSAYGVLQGLRAKDRLRVKEMAEEVLEDRKRNAIRSYQLTEMDLERPEKQEQIRDKFVELDNIEDFVDWFSIEYLDKNFEFFETRFFVFNQNWERVDRYKDALPPVVLKPGEEYFSIDEVGVPIEEGMEEIFEIPSRDDRFTEAYIAHFKLDLDSVNQFNIFLELSSNPHGVGSIAPVVLIRTNTYQEEEFFSDYDYAIYKDRKLLMSSGETAFPINLPKEWVKQEGFFRDLGESVEYVQSFPYAQNNSWRSLVARYPKRNLFDGFTIFSFIFYFYTFCLFIFLIGPAMLFRLARFRSFISTLPIRTRIRLALVVVSIMPILGIIVFLYPYIKTRYRNQAEAEIIAETKRVTRILEDEVSGLNNSLSKDNYLKQLRDRLEAMSSTMPNDIHVYNEKGRLIGSTKPQLFELGISSGLMNDVAFDSVRNGSLSNLVMDEHLGNLQYLGGYQAVVGNSSQPVGYINVAFLNKKEEVNSQVFGMLAYMANIYLLAFLLVGLVAVVVSNAITQPLSLIQQRLATTRLGNVNKPIDYNSNDEIGAIVSAYNSMVDKLAESEQKLKATQRQLAWRQMARQVAHEIKNPLTPMRLRIQQLVRAWNSDSPNLDKMFPKVMKTLLSQIDSMVNIANSFSQFAKMPDAVKAEVSLTEVMNEVVDLYDQAENITWDISIPDEPFTIHADRDQISRAIGNIVKNGIQAMDEGGHMDIHMQLNGDHALVTIADNGPGMNDEIKSRIFEPNFSTKTSGMGLGLAIVKRIIETTGGEIWFETTEGQGTSFFIKFPGFHGMPGTSSNGEHAGETAHPPANL